MMTPRATFAGLLVVIIACSWLRMSDASSPKSKLATSQSDPPELQELVVINGKNYYFFMQDSVSWYRAGEMCAAKNMTLASLETQQEDDALYRWLLLHPAYDQFLWTSGARLDGATWRWEASGEALSYVGWGVGQPSLPEGTPACINILASPQRYWDDDVCEMTLHFLCEEPGA